MSIKKWFFALTGSMAFLMLASCGGGVKEVMLACVYPDAPTTEAPTWICDEPVEGVVVSAVLPGAVFTEGGYWDETSKTNPEHVQKYLQEYS